MPRDTPGLNQQNLYEEKHEPGQEYDAVCSTEQRKGRPPSRWIQDCRREAGGRRNKHQNGHPGEEPPTETALPRRVDRVRLVCCPFCRRRLDRHSHCLPLHRIEQVRTAASPLITRPDTVAILRKKALAGIGKKRRRSYSHSAWVFVVDNDHRKRSERMVGDPPRAHAEPGHRGDETRCPLTS